jgi:Ni,Fe-hydrogenase III large subunit
MPIASKGVVRNGHSVPVADVPVLTFPAFRETLLNSGGRIAALFGRAAAAGKARITAVIAGRQELLHIVSTDVKDSFPSLTSELPQVHLFEREVAEQCGLRPEGHPWLKPVRFPAAPVGVMDFFRMDGEEVHEVAVGPVHAGVIEPGHFRFQCHGENVFHLEISLGYQHRGIERKLQGGPDKRTLHYMETLAGDTTIGHATAYCQAVEALAGANVSPRAQTLRAIALELERLANHVGDLGALANDVGYLPTASYCGRIRGDFLNLTALLCGNRFGRGLLRPGGVGIDLDEAGARQALGRLEAALKDVTIAADLLWNSVSVMARFEQTGAITPEQCQELGLVGVAARACGVERDVRHEFPWGLYRAARISISTAPSGDVYARTYVRWLEIQTSAAFVREQLQALSDGPVRVDVGPLAPEQIAVSLIEGWRGEICHVAVTDARGRFAAYKIVDPSFHNWTGLAMALRNQQISDFPLCNKSFNLSYCGFDL